MDLIAYVHSGWEPLIRPAPATRTWMDATPESFAYRCLPLNIANAHGWEVLTPAGFEARWNGGGGTDAIEFKLDEGVDPKKAAVSLFGQGVITFHIESIIRTPPGWNLWVGGSPNRLKDGIGPLSGVIETDWSPFTFTMNWRFTRPDHWIRFDPGEPFCFIHPLRRDAVESFTPSFQSLDDDPATMARFTAWSEERDAFHKKMAQEPATSGSQKWQKHYYRGVDVAGEALINDHRAKLRLRPFDRSATPQIPAAPMEDRAGAATATALISSTPPDLQVRKRDWWLQAMERQRQLSPAASVIERRSGVGRQEFLDRYYAPGRPVLLCGELSAWPALSRWTPDYLAQKIGPAIVEYQGDRSRSPTFEMHKQAHSRTEPFDAFLARIARPGAANDAYLTAYNAARNAEALAPLWQDIRPLDSFLRSSPGDREGMMWIGPAGAFTPLHHDLTNNLFAQVIGRKRIKLAPPTQAGRLYNHTHVFSDITDLDGEAVRQGRYPGLEGASLYEIDVLPGELLFIPLGWWHQVRALDFSISMTFTNFLWPNDAAASYPAA